MTDYRIAPDLPPMERQRVLEETMRTMGLERYRALIQEAETRGEATRLHYGRTLLARAVAPTRAAIDEWLVKANSGRAGRKHLAAGMLAELDLDVVALITSKVLIDQAHLSNPLQAKALAIGNMLEEEIDLGRFTSTNKRLADATVEGLIKQTGNRGQRSRSLVNAMNRYGVERVGWATTDKVHLGTKLAELFCKATGLMSMRQYVSKAKKHVTLAVSPEMADLIDRARQLALPTLLPCLVPPRDWTGIWAGGYHTKSLRQLPFVKTRNRGLLEELQNMPGQLDRVYRAANAMQRTAWRIRRPIFDVMQEAWDRRLPIAKLPDRSPLTIPTSPVPSNLKKADMSEEQAEAFKEWKRQARDIHEYNARVVGKKVQVAKVLEIAAVYAEEPAFYFPYQADFRGRLYAVPMFLQPQGSDFAKALLEFADGLPIKNDRAAGWLAIHGANVFGFDKASLEERIGWVADNEETILRAAADPLDGVALDFWSRADKPWQFLAWCMEWAGFLREGYGFVSRMPIALDGSCNGLQHYAALLRDPVSGRSVNLTPGDAPSDIYADVAAVVTRKLEALVDSGEDDDGMAAAWLAWGVGRSDTKRSVMVLPYGGTRFSCRDFVMERLVKRAEEDKENPCPWGKEERFKAAGFLAGFVWDSIGEVVVSARTGMDWLRSTSRAVVKNEVPVVWQAPSGFIVVQAYANLKLREVKTRFGDKVIKLQVAEELDTLDVTRNVNGVAPNFVHSLDAAHMVDTIGRCLDDGIEDFAMIHDSYGTHAANTDVLADHLRAAFVEMYAKNDPLVDFWERQRVAAGQEFAEGIAEPPAKGTLDIASVLDSQFFFA